jgi:hypothetical protein
MRTRWRLRVTQLSVFASLATAAGLLLAPPSAVPQDPEPDIVRSSRTYGREAAAFADCRTDVCGGRPSDPFSVTLPDEVGRSDVTISLTLEYSASRGDTPLVEMRMGGNAPLPPGELALRSGGPDTATLTWIKRNVDPGTYSVRWAFGFDEMEPPFVVRVSDALLVVEATSG